MGSIPGLGRQTAWRRQWEPTPASLPGESHGQQSLVGHVVTRVRHDLMTTSPPSPSLVLVLSGISQPVYISWPGLFIPCILLPKGSFEMPLPFCLHNVGRRLKKNKHFLCIYVFFFVYMYFNMGFHMHSSCAFSVPLSLQRQLY